MSSSPVQALELPERHHRLQDEIEHSTELIRCYISWLLEGRPVPSLETLESMAAELGIPAYRLFYDETEQVRSFSRPSFGSFEDFNDNFEARTPDARFLHRVEMLASESPDAERAFLLDFARKYPAC